MYWISHLASSTAATEKATSQQRQLGNDYDRFLAALWSFFAQRLVVTAWIEACYVLRAHPCAEELQRRGTVIRTMERQMSAAPMDISEVGRPRSCRFGWIPNDFATTVGLEADQLSWIHMGRKYCVYTHHRQIVVNHQSYTCFL